MKNKFIITFLISVLILSFFKIVIAEEFNFNITELQVSESGNIIRGVNGGKVTTKNNEIVIIADNFKYNKSTTFLEAEGNVKLYDKISNVVIESNELFYLKSKEEIYTKGKSKAIKGVDIQINANQYFKYNKLTSLLEARGDVRLEDKRKDITINTNEIFYLINEEKIYTLGKTNISVEDSYDFQGSDLTLLRNEMILSSIKKATIVDEFSNIYKLGQFKYSINQKILKGDKITLLQNKKENETDQYFFETGFFKLNENKFLGKDINIKFHKTLFDDEKNDPRINAASGHGDENNTYLKKGVFTTCKKTDKCPPWKMKADHVHHDKIKKKITYKNAWLELYDFPVVYFPKFFHPDPSVKRQTGILRPAIGDHNTHGDSIYLPYFFVISDDKDITVKPRLFNDNKLVLQNEYRQISKNSLTIIDSSILNGYKANPKDKEQTRSHFFANSKINLNLKKFKTSSLEINYEKISSDNYLKSFNFIESPLLLNNNDVLESLIKLDFAHENYDLTSSFEMYETLDGLNSDRYQYVLPTYNFSKNFSKKNINGSFNFNSSGNNTLSGTNVTTSSISNGLSYSSNNLFFDNGIKTNYEVLLKNINSTGKNSTEYKNTLQSEVMSTYNYNISLPLIKNDENYNNSLIPKLSFRLSPHDMKNNRETDRRINVDNVFSADRLSLGNSYEAGESIALGIDFIKEKVTTKKTDKSELNEIEEYLDFKLATVLRLNEEKNIPINSTLNKKNSNIFGRINFKPSEMLLLSYDFSLKNDLNTFEYNSLNAKFSFDNFSTRFNFLEERGVIGTTNVIENTSQYNFDENNSILFKTRRNKNLNLTEYYDLVYEYKNDCLIADIKYKKDYYSDVDIKPKEELFFSITIVPFYTYSPDKMILNKDRID